MPAGSDTGKGCDGVPTVMQPERQAIAVSAGRRCTRFIEMLPARCYGFARRLDLGALAVVSGGGGCCRFPRRARILTDGLDVPPEVARMVADTFQRLQHEGRFQRN